MSFDFRMLDMGQHRTNESVRWRMNFLSDAIADGEKGIANAANELCGVAITHFISK